jgi:accessory gene regulator B
MLLDLPERVAGYLRDRLDLGREEEEKALYALQVFYYTGLAFAGAALAGWLLGCLAETVVVGLALFLFRCFSGGAHCRTPLGCIFSSAFFVPLTGWLVSFTGRALEAGSILFLSVAGFFISALLAGLYAPVDSPAKPVASPEQRRRYKSLSVLTVFVIFALQAAIVRAGPDLPWARQVALALGAGMWWQVFSLTGAGNRFFAFFDNFFCSLSFKERKGGAR